MPDTRWLYVGVIGLVVLERLAELVITERNARRLRARGGFEVGRAHFLPMALLHTGLLAAAPLEVFWRQRPFLPLLGGLMLLLLAGTMALRYWAIASLGDRWTTRVFVVPGEPPVARGPYRWLRHPNYLAVIVEVAAMPLIHSAWWTALAFSIGNALVLRVRIRVEEEALASHSDYQGVLGDRPRIVPGRTTASASD
jgi:methyltransferase